MLIVEGPDAARYLQGQASADLQPFSPGRWQKTLWLDAKAHPLGSALIIQTGEERFCIMEVDRSVDEVLQQLDAFIVADDVELNPLLTVEKVNLLYGTGLKRWCEANGIPPFEAGHYQEYNGAYLTPSPWHGEESLLWIDLEEGDTFQQALVQASLQGTPVEIATTPQLALWRSLKGAPVIGESLLHQDLAPEGGFSSHWLAEDKGCYRGQEVVSRLRTRGGLRRQLWRVLIEGPAPPHGTMLKSEERKVGEFRGTIPNLSSKELGLEGGEDYQVGFAMLKTSFSNKTATCESEATGKTFVHKWQKVEV